MTRRDFINGVPVAAAGIALAAGARSANAQAVRYPLGIQLFALIGRDLPRTWEKYSAAIEIAASMGYEFIEPAGLWGFDPKTIRKKAEDSGLRVRSLHMGFDQMNDLPPGHHDGPGAGSGLRVGKHRLDSAHDGSGGAGPGLRMGRDRFVGDFELQIRR